ncbi:MAG: alkaline phosphatase family protein [Caulobacteraceae bacterium]|nr:alkaline phosphatase family protein [Caulobacteraceae bacterium]
MFRRLVSFGLVAASLAAPMAFPAPLLAAMTAADRAVPRYAHVFVIVEENKNYAQIMDPASAPNIASLAVRYGDAAQFFGEVHPSEANYVALLGGDTFGIHDDDGYYCHAGMTDLACAGAAAPGYADHTVTAPNLGQQLEAAGLTWKGYYESLPAPGSLVVTASDPAFDNGTRKTALYASKHSGFMNFAWVQHHPKRAERIVGFGQLDADLAADRLPSFALIVPNQCNEMHGLHGVGLPPDCDGADTAGLIRRGDKEVGQLVARIQATSAWRSNQNVAIVVTFDEGAGRTREGCCSVTPGAPSNFGGGHIPTIVITNHGPRGLKDETAYNHYSLLRTMEDAFGLGQHLGRAGDDAGGVVAMAPLFAISKPQAH